MGEEEWTLAILVVGSVALDSVETPFTKVENVLGGAASYFTLAAANYDAVRLVAVVGEDFPEHYTECLRQVTPDLRGVQVRPGATFRWGGRYAMDMNARETLFTHLGVFGDFHPQIPTEYHDSPILFLANILPSLQLDVLRQMRAGGSPRLVALDTMNLWIETTRDELTEVVKQVDVLLIAEDEVRQYTGEANLRTGARTMLALGPKLLVVKQGSYGALLFGADGSFFAAPAYPLEDVCDPTGAGDAFAGGFLGYLAQRLSDTGEIAPADYRRALIHGNIMGSFACEDFSVERLRRLSPEDVAARYAEFVAFTHFDGPWRG